MQTRCPACQTLYRIDQDVLQRAGGQARCFRCDQVFDAYSQRVEEDDPELGDTLADIDDDGIANTDADADTSAILSDLADLPDVPNPSGFEPHSELDLDDLANSLREPPQSQDAPPDEPVEPEFLSAPMEGGDSLTRDPLDVPSELAPDALRTDSLLTEEPDTPHRQVVRHPSNLPAFLLAALLLLLALAQLAWFNRDLVLGTPQGQAMAEGICGLVGCELAPRRAASQYAVMHRDIGADPGEPGVLRMQLSFQNQADFAQPLPDIQLSLYDSEEKLMARRRLHPDEYLFPAPPSDTLVAPGETVSVTLRLEDPGRHTTGFKLEFL